MIFIEKEWKKKPKEWNLNTDYRRMWNATFIYKKKLIKKKNGWLNNSMETIELDRNLEHDNNVKNFDELTIVE